MPGQARYTARDADSGLRRGQIRLDPGSGETNDGGRSDSLRSLQGGPRGGTPLKGTETTDRRLDEVSVGSGSSDKLVLMDGATQHIMPSNSRSIGWMRKRIGPRIRRLQVKRASGLILVSKFEQSGLSYQRVPPGYRFPYGHTHKKQEEVFVVLRGSGRMKLDDEIVELKEWDAASRPVRGEATRPGRRASRSSSSARPISARLRAKTSRASATGGLTSARQVNMKRGEVTHPARAEAAFGVATNLGETGGNSAQQKPPWECGIAVDATP